MATNLRHATGDTLSLPVGAGIESGDPVLVGDLSGVALTDRGAGGNPAEFATVQVGVNSAVFTVEVEATDGNIVAGDRLYIDVAGAVSNDPTDHAFGFAIPTPGQTGNLVASGQTGDIHVLLGSGAVDAS